MSECERIGLGDRAFCVFGRGLYPVVIFGLCYNVCCRERVEIVFGLENGICFRRRLFVDVMLRFCDEGRIRLCSYTDFRFDNRDVVCYR